MEEYSYTSTHPLSYTGPVTVKLYLFLLTHSLTHSLTHWSRVFLEKLTGLKLVKKFPVSEPALFGLIIFHVPSLVSRFVA